MSCPLTYIHISLGDLREFAPGPRPTAQHVPRVPPRPVAAECSEAWRQRERLHRHGLPRARIGKLLRLHGVERSGADHYVVPHHLSRSGGSNLLNS